MNWENNGSAEHPIGTGVLPVISQKTPGEAPMALSSL
jgi:hypothetical protein